MPPPVSPMRGDIVEEVLRAMSCTGRMQDTESDTGYDTRRRWSDGALARLSQTAVCDTCGSATSAFISATTQLRNLAVTHTLVLKQTRA